jgi:hypothetical protein
MWKLFEPRSTAAKDSLAAWVVIAAGEFHYDWRQERSFGRKAQKTQQPADPDAARQVGSFGSGGARFRPSPDEARALRGGADGEVAPQEGLRAGPDPEFARRPRKSAVAFDANIYEAGVAALLRVLRGREEKALLLVGHNPGFDELLLHLCSEPPPRDDEGKLLTTAAIAVLDLENGPRRGSAQLVALKRPKEPG